MRAFGKLEDGRGVEAITLGDAQGLQAELLTYGAILRRLTYPVNGRRRDLVLSLPTLEDYVRDRAYVGALVGRFGNRIGRGGFAEPLNLARLGDIPVLAELAAQVTAGRAEGEHAGARIKMIQRLLFDRVDAEARAAAVGG